MEFPFGHCRDHQHHPDNGDGDTPPPYPPPSTYPPPRPPYPPYGSAYPPPPSAELTGAYGSYGGGVDSQSYPPSNPPLQCCPPPQYPPSHSFAHHEVHVSYQTPPLSSVESEGGEGQNRHHFRPHMPSFIGSHIHHAGHSSHTQGYDLASKPSVRVYCKADTNYSLAIRDGQVILAQSDPDDPSQHWVKDEKYSTRVKDQEGFPCFALVNKATGQAIKHSVGATQPVLLTPYNPDKLDQSVLWTMSKDVGDGYRTIRMVNNIKLNLDAFHGDKDHGGVHDGTTIVVWEWAKGDNQSWKIIHY